MTDGEAQFIDKARASLELRLEQTPAHVSSRLSAARHRALDSRRRRQQAWLPAMATAALVVAVVSGVWLGYTPEPEGMVIAGLTQHAADFEMLTAGDDLALYADMDFYLWLDQRGLDAG